MNLQRIRRLGLCIALGAGLFLFSPGFVNRESASAQTGKTILQKLGFSPHANPQPEVKQTSPLTLADDPYTIGPEDVLQINVWHEPEMSGPVPVRPDGKISMPLVGEMEVSGLTPLKLQAALTEKLRAFISNPEVAVSVQQVKSKNFNILGEVEHPGTYPLAHSVSVLDAIGVAGGFRDFAKVTKIYVLRRTPGGETVRLPFNYKEVIKGDRTDQNVELKPEDTVIVP
jgi:polysaccharide export outer membrane protein